MQLNELYAVLEGFAPKSLSDEYCKKYDGYDNSGILIDCGGEAEKILFALDLSSAALDAAERAGANVIVTHHPAIYAKIGNILCTDPQGEKIAAGAQKRHLRHLHASQFRLRGGGHRRVAHARRRRRTGRDL